MQPGELKRFGDKRFENHIQVLTLWQTIAQHFYPERADFTQPHNIGEELGIGLASSQPVLIRRELGDSIGAMLRDGTWFNMGIDGDPDLIGKQWLEWASTRMFKFINNRAANFRRATKEGDHDYATFGNAVISVELNKHANGLLFRNWHMKDVAWWDNDEGKVDGVVRKWSPALHEVKTYFNKEGDNIHEDVEKLMGDPRRMFDKLDLYHFDITVDMYGDERYSRFQRVSVFMDTKREHVIRVVPKNHVTYVVPRFQTIAGSAYAYSPATVVGLPEARTIQAMTHTLLEAGERIAQPPIIATQGVIRGDANLFANGITYTSEEYDERLGAAIKTLETDARGFPYGAEMREGVVEVLQSAFFVNKINMPDLGHEMTAYEVQERMKQYRRENLPLFTPIEHEYNGQLCEVSFEILMENGLLGSHQDIPRSLSNQDVVFKFESPLSLADEEKKATTFAQVSQLLREAAEFDTSVVVNLNFDEAIRDAIDGAGAPAAWLNSVDEVAKMREARAAEQQMMMEMQADAGAAAA
jgi:hypothetical protein